MEAKQLALFSDDQVVGTGAPHPWPIAASQDEEGAPDSNPDQLAFDDTEAEAAA